MKGKHTVIVVTALSMVPLLCFSSPQGPVDSSPAAGPVLLGGDSFLKPPAYDSGSQPITAGTSLTLDHNLGGNADDYLEDLTFARADGAHLGH